MIEISILCFFAGYLTSYLVGRRQINKILSSQSKIEAHEKKLLKNFEERDRTLKEWEVHLKGWSKYLGEYKAEVDKRVRKYTLNNSPN